MRETSEALRPREFALLLLAAGDSAPRLRARDQRADRAGLALKRRLLEELLAADPEPEQMEAALLQITERIGPPFGPTRAIALALQEEWRLARTTPQFTAHLLDAAAQPPASEGRRRGRQLPG